MMKNTSKLSERVEEIVEKLARENINNDKALRDAEVLADKYKDVRPQPFSIPMERFVGLPTFHNEKDA